MWHRVQRHTFSFESGLGGIGGIRIVVNFIVQRLNAGMVHQIHLETIFIANNRLFDAEISKINCKSLTLNARTDRFRT